MASTQAAKKEKARRTPPPPVKLQPRARAEAGPSPHIGAVPPVAKPRREHDAYAERIGQPRAAQIALEGPARIDRDDIQIVPGPQFKDKVEHEAFMAEKVTVLIHQSAEQHPVNPVMLSVNGRQIFIWRNEPTIIRRCYLERLARAKPEGINQDAANPNPDIANKLNIGYGLLYPFSVIEDPNRNGHAWLQRILAEC